MTRFPSLRIQPHRHPSLIIHCQGRQLYGYRMRAKDPYYWRCNGGSLVRFYLSKGVRNNQDYTIKAGMDIKGEGCFMILVNERRPRLEERMKIVNLLYNLNLKHQAFSSSSGSVYLHSVQLISVIFSFINKPGFIFLSSYLGYSSLFPVQISPFIFIGLVLYLCLQLLISENSIIINYRNGK